MLTLTQIYAEAWSQLDPDLADVIVTSLPQPRTPAHDTPTEPDAALPARVPAVRSRPADSLREVARIDD